MESGGKTPCMLDLITRWKLVVNTCSGLFKTTTKKSPIPTKGGKTLPSISPKEAFGGEDVVSILKHIFADMSLELATLIFSVQEPQKYWTVCTEARLL